MTRTQWFYIPCIPCIPLFTLLQSEMSTDGVTRGRYDQPLSPSWAWNIDVGSSSMRNRDGCFIHPWRAFSAVGVVEGRSLHTRGEWVELPRRNPSARFVWIFGALGAFGAIGARIAEHQGAAMVGFEMNDRRSKCKPSHNRLHNLSLSLLHWEILGLCLTQMQNGHGDGMEQRSGSGWRDLESCSHSWGSSSSLTRASWLWAM